MATFSHTVKLITNGNTGTACCENCKVRVRYGNQLLDKKSGPTDLCFFTRKVEDTVKQLQTIYQTCKLNEQKKTNVCILMKYQNTNDFYIHLYLKAPGINQNVNAMVSAWPESKKPNGCDLYMTFTQSEPNKYDCK